MNNTTRIKTQSIENLKGEIDFRKKLAIQHVSGDTILPDYYTKEEHNQILLERIETTIDKMEELQNLGVGFSPFLELGAERGQRSLVLANDFSGSGFAVDISYHQLRTMEHFSKLFQREKLPVRICCDANHLPFKSNSFPFVFCYQFLHHFPSLSPIVSEIFRVLSDGYFYFDEEPFIRMLKVVLYRQKSKIYSRSTLRKNRYVNLLESFISAGSCDEAEHGIIENNDIPLAEWIKALSIFDDRDTDLHSIYNFRSKLSNHLRLSNIPNFLLGGRINGLCRKKIQVDGNPQMDIHTLLGCPDCRIPERDGSFDRPALTNDSGGFICSQCSTYYPCKDGIIFLLPKAELQQLYPEI